MYSLMRAISDILFHIDVVTTNGNEIILLQVNRLYLINSWCLQMISKGDRLMEASCIWFRRRSRLYTMLILRSYRTNSRTLHFLIYLLSRYPWQRSSLSIHYKCRSSMSRKNPKVLKKKVKVYILRIYHYCC